jgi:hypothetical protein
MRKADEMEVVQMVDDPGNKSAKLHSSSELPAESSETQTAADNTMTVSDTVREEKAPSE